MKTKRFCAFAAAIAIVLSQASIPVSAQEQASGNDTIYWVFDSIPQNNQTVSGINYTKYGNTDWVEGSLKATANSAGAGFTLEDEAKSILKDYPLILEGQFTVSGESASFNALQGRNSSSNGNNQELIGFFPQNKWRLFKWTKEIPLGSDFAGNVYTYKFTADYQNNLMTLAATEKSADAESEEYTVSLPVEDSDTLGGEFADGISLLQMYLSNNSVYNYARIGYIANAPEAETVSFDDAEYQEGTPVSREASKITVTFNQPIDAESIAGQASLVSATGKNVSANAVLGSDSKSLEISIGRMQKETQYTLTLDTGIKNSLGIALAQPYTLVFTTDNSGEVIPPSISISADIANVAEGDTLAIAAAVNGGESDIEKVEYFDNGSSLGEITEFPYTYTIDSISNGTHSIYAVITNADGETAQSNELSFMVDKYISEIVYDKDGTGDSQTIMGDLIKIDQTLTITADNFEKTYQQVMKLGNSAKSEYIWNVWCIYSDLSTNFGIKLQNGDTVKMTTVIDTSTGEVKRYVNDIYYDNVALSDANKELAKNGIVRFAETNGGNSGCYTSHVTMYKMTKAILPSGLVFKKNGQLTGYGLNDATDIEVSFNKTLPEDVSFDGKVTMTSSDGQTVEFEGTFADNIYTLKPAEVLTAGKVYTITFDGVDGMSNKESISFAASSAFELKACSVAKDGTTRATVVNNTASSQSFAVIAALYDNEGNVLEYADFANGTVDSGKTVSLSLKLENYSGKSSQTVKFMLWDSMKTIKPLCGVTEIK